jgi:hypothetical protein
MKPAEYQSINIIIVEGSIILKADRVKGEIQPNNVL